MLSDTTHVKRAFDAGRLKAALFWIAFLGGLGRALWLMQHSTGSPLDDEIGHFLLSRDIWSHPQLALSLWGRSLNTLIYAIPAAFGLEAARYFSLAMTCASMGITWLLAKRLSLASAYLIPVFFWFQPWVLELSPTCLTEVPFLLFMIAGLYGVVCRNELSAGLLLGSLPLIRHEGVAIVAAGLAYAVLTKRWRLLASLAIPYAGYAIAYFAVKSQWPLSIFAESKPTDIYGSGGWLHFAPLIAAAAGPVLVAALYGTPRLLRTNGGSAVLSAYALYLLVHVAIFRFGLFASGGYVEFLLPLVPAFALAAVAGLDVLSEQFGRSEISLPWNQRLPPRLAQWSCVFALVAATVAFGLARSHSHDLKPVQSASLDAARWMRDRNFSGRRIEATNVWFYYALPLPFPDPADLVLRSTPLDLLPAGTIVAWDQKYSDGWGRPLTQMTADPRQWRRLAGFGPHDEVILFERL